MSNDKIIWHEYRRVHPPGRLPRRETLCFGKWYTTGTAPCEVEDTANLADIRTLPDCEASEEDLAAMKELMGLSPRVTRCRTKGRSSWGAAEPPIGTYRTNEKNQLEMYEGNGKWLDIGRAVDGVPQP